MSTISSHITDLVNNYISIRAQRLAKDKEAAEMAELEKVLKDEIVLKFRNSNMDALGSVNGVVKMTRLIEPRADDWPAIREYIVEHNAFELLHARLTSTAVKERWDAGEEIPGVGRSEVYKLSVSKPVAIPK